MVQLKTMVGLVVAALPISTAVLAETQVAYSERLGVQILATSPQWCSDRPAFRIIAKDPKVFTQPDFAELIQKLGTNVVGRSCPAARSVELRGSASDGAGTWSDTVAWADSWRLHPAREPATAANLDAPPQASAPPPTSPPLPAARPQVAQAASVPAPPASQPQAPVDTRDINGAWTTKPVNNLAIDSYDLVVTDQGGVIKPFVGCEYLFLKSEQDSSGSYPLHSLDSRCTDQGSVTLTRRSIESLDYRYTPFQPGKPSTTATFRRTGGPITVEDKGPNVDVIGLTLKSNVADFDAALASPTWKKESGIISRLVGGVLASYQTYIKLLPPDTPIIYNQKFPDYVGILISAQRDAAEGSDPGKARPVVVFRSWHPPQNERPISTSLIAQLKEKYGASSLEGILDNNTNDKYVGWYYSPDGKLLGQSDGTKCRRIGNNSGDTVALASNVPGDHTRVAGSATCGMTLEVRIMQGSDGIVSDLQEALYDQQTLYRSLYLSEASQADGKIQSYVEQHEQATRARPRL